MGENNDELRHALRSIAANLPHSRVWIAGYKPRWVRNTQVIPRPQGGTKHTNSLSNITAACHNIHVSEEFVLWNDDFYLMEPIKHPLPVLHRGLIRSMLEDLNGHRPSEYMRGLAATAEILLRLGIAEPLSYELHVPMTLTKTAVLKALKAATGPDMPRTYALQPRSLVGNLEGLGGEQVEDVKVSSPKDPPIVTNLPFLSSGDASWGRHPTLAKVKRMFEKPCRYEKEGVE